MKNLFDVIPDELPEELFDSLASSQSVQIERIVSRGHRSADGFWYDQPKNEFVVVLKGRARLQFEDGRMVEMMPGDWLNIPAHDRHRVDWTDQRQDTVWLAVHYR